MRLTRITAVSGTLFTLPPLLLSVILSSLIYSKNVHSLADDSIRDPKTDRPRPPDALNNKAVLGGLKSEYEDLVERYVPDFVGISRSIIGRAGDEIQALDNNQPGKNSIQDGQTQYYTFPKSALSGPKSPSTTGLPSTIARRNEQAPGDLPLDQRQSQVQLYITFNTCSQPLPNNENANGGAGQLQLFVSTASSNQKPDLNNNNYAPQVDGGYTSLDFAASDDVFISVSAPNNNGFTGNYSYELTASIDDFYAKNYSHPFHRVVDTDTSSVLLYSKNVTSQNTSATILQQWMNKTFFTAYVYSEQSPAVVGIQNSLCALNTNPQLYMNQTNDTGMTTAVDGQAKQQFHVGNLHGNSTYYAALAIEGNSTSSGGGVVNGGGTLWASTSFTTKADNNCLIVHNLPFCTDVGYAVPYNHASNLTDPVELGQRYDQNASATYHWFDLSLQQVACNTTSSAKYSLARTCTDCAVAYKQWLCAVLMPRCEDFSNPAPYLQPRAVLNDPHTYTSQSRNPLIDSVINPGPYKELLPCKDLCYNLVQSCPAVLQFQCPLPGFGLNYSYGNWNSSLTPGELSPDEYYCNPMAVKVSRATGLKGSGILGIMMSAATILVAVLV